MTTNTIPIAETFSSIVLQISACEEVIKAETVKKEKLLRQLDLLVAKALGRNDLPVEEKESLPEKKKNSLPEKKEDSPLEKKKNSLPEKKEDLPLEKKDPSSQGIFVSRRPKKSPTSDENPLSSIVKMEQSPEPEVVLKKKTSAKDETTFSVVSRQQAPKRTLAKDPAKEQRKEFTELLKNYIQKVLSHFDSSITLDADKIEFDKVTKIIFRQLFEKISVKEFIAILDEKKIPYSEISKGFQKPEVFANSKILIWEICCALTAIFPTNGYVNDRKKQFIKDLMNDDVMFYDIVKSYICNDRNSRTFLDIGNEIFENYN